MGTRAIFLDKDGTLVENMPFNVDPEKMRLMPGAVEGGRLLHRAGYLLVVISNQAGVAHGYFQEYELARVKTRLEELLAQAGVPLSGFYYCPHHPAGKVAGYGIICDCRKPAPGLIWRAVCELDIDLTGSWFIGDILDDIEAGRRAGCLTALIDNGNETEWRFSAERIPHVTATDLAQAARRIADRSGNTKVFINTFQ